MKRLPTAIRVTLAVVFLLAGASPGAGTLPAAAAPAAAVSAAGSGDLMAFQLVAAGVGATNGGAHSGVATADAGWALLGQQLYWTADGGAHWRDITPPDMGTAEIRTASFADTNHGWVVATAPAASGGVDYTLAHTADGGQTWQAAPLALFAAGDVAGMAGEVYLQFIDAGTGWLEVKQATSSNFNVGVLFKTVDGGEQWTRLSLPTGAPAHFSSALDGQIDATDSGNGRYVTRDGGQSWSTLPGPSTAANNWPNGPNGPNGERLSELSMATAQAGWARSAQGQCTAGTCALVTQLLSTADGGQNWTPVSLPGGQTLLASSFPAATAAAPGQSAGGLRVIYDGHGFDNCKNDGSLPATSDMQNWYSFSPYGVWNLYIGGSSRANCGSLTRTYVQVLAKQGWLFIPTWVGPQAPCSNLGTRMSFDLTTAYNQGVTEAFLARNVAKNLGLTLSDLSGSIIYYDVEYYQGDQGCRDAVKAFMSGWSGELHATGDLSGVYGAPCGPSLSDFAQVTNVPDLIWIAAWSYPGYDPSASVWWQGCGLNNSLWINHQRLRQYAGGHNENWAGVTFNIDSDRIVGNLSTVTDACAPGPGQVALFVYPNYGGQCVVKGRGGYSTTAALGLPAQSISSLRVSSGVTVTVCQGENYTQTCSVFGSDRADLGGTAVGNNQALSAKISGGTLTLSQHVFMPLIGSNPGPATQLGNGGFEDGPAEWSASSVAGRSLIVPDSVLNSASVAPHSGSWAAWLGDGPGNALTETASLQQTVLIRPEAPYLGYWQWVDSGEAACYFDVATVWVNDTVVDSFGLCAPANTYGWARHVINLSGSAGSTVTLKLQVQTDRTVNSNLFLDDLAFQSGP